MPIATAYKPIVRARKGDYKGAALVGANSVILGLDVVADQPDDDLMGFAVRRTEFDPDSGDVLRKRWLNGRKRFEGAGDDPDVENTLSIEGDRRLIAMVTTEFLRMYDHYKIRYWINKALDENSPATLFLDSTQKWLEPYFDAEGGSRKFRDRQVFAGGA